MSAEPGRAHTSTAVSLSELRSEGLRDQLGRPNGLRTLAPLGEGRATNQARGAWLGGVRLGVTQV